MKLPKPFSVVELAKRTGSRLLGDKTLMATGLNEIHKVEPGDVTFVDHPKYYTKSLQSPATIILIDKEVECPPGKCLLISKHPFEAYDQLVRQFRPFKPVRAYKSRSAEIPKSCIIEPGVVIANNVVIGEHCYLQAGAYIGEHTIIGNRVSIGPGTVIGSDAFYYKKEGERYIKWRSGGRVVIENDVDIAANCTINKGVSGDTVIGEGSKLDCLVHIGHGAVVGKNCLLAGQVGIGGKTVIGDRCILYGQVGVAQSLTIGDDVIILAKSGVSKDLPGGNVYFGAPAEPAREKYKELAALRQLPEMIRKGKK